MEQNSPPIDAKDLETLAKQPNISIEASDSPLPRDGPNPFESSLSNSPHQTQSDTASNESQHRPEKRPRSNKYVKTPKRQSLSPRVSLSFFINDSGSESRRFADGVIDLYGPSLEREAKMQAVEHMSPLRSSQQDLGNPAYDNNLGSDTAIDEPTYSDTGMAESEHMNASQAYTHEAWLQNTNEATNTQSAAAAAELDLTAEQDLSAPNPSQGFDLLQNMHCDADAHRHQSQTFGAGPNALDDAGPLELATQGNQHNSQYLFQYNANSQEHENFMDYNEDMNYTDNVNYILSDDIDYVMDANYNNDNTNLASNNFDANNAFNNADNLTQSQEQTTNTRTVRFNLPPEVDDMGGAGASGTDTQNELMRNNSINMLIEAADTHFDKDVMSSILRDLICPICLEYFYFPVTVACGHTFCRYCIGHSKLSGKRCPLCRQHIGRSHNINTILSNMVKSLKLRKRGHAALARAPDVSQMAEKVWWDEHCLKPYVSVPLFIRIMLGETAQAPVFFDDLCSCLIDYFSSENRWYKSKWVFTIEDFRLIRNMIGLQLLNANASAQPGAAGGADLAATVNDTNNVRLHHWVEDYLIANPHLCFRSDVMYPLTLKVYHDVNHKIEGAIFSALDIPYKLPWDAGRHAKSLLHLPHSSVSLSHLIFAQCPNGQFGILDVGSTIGTMIKLQGVHVLRTGDRIHIGDKHEVDVHIYRDSIGMPFRDYKWDARQNKVINYSDYMSTRATCGSDPEASDPEAAIDLDAEDESNLHDLDSYLKLKIFADLQVERDVWICPKGVILGRGPVTQSSYKKLSITTQNGYISREHCLIYYDGSRPSGSRWLLRDMSTLGTFLKLKPFEEPLPVSPGFVFKVGQCKVEVGSPHELSRRVPSSATLILSQLLHSHIEPFRMAEMQQVGQANPVSGLAAALPNGSAGDLAPDALSEVNRLEREVLSRIQREPAENRPEDSSELCGDVDPEGELVPDAMRDDVL